jgi:hypothetical protein
VTRADLLAALTLERFGPVPVLERERFATKPGRVLALPRLGLVQMAYEAHHDATVGRLGGAA